MTLYYIAAAAAAAKLLQSCPTLCDPIDVSPPGYYTCVYPCRYDSEQSPRSCHQGALSLEERHRHVKRILPHCV